MNLLHNHQINQVFRAFSEPVRFLGPFLVGAVCLDMEYGSAVYLDAVLLVILEGVLLVDMGNAPGGGYPGIPYAGLPA